jgi:hypothetical protein
MLSVFCGYLIERSKIMPVFCGQGITAAIRRWHKIGIEEIKVFMKLIPTLVHGYLDYIVGAILIASPWIFGFAHGGAETWVPVAQGAFSILYSILTNYELGLVRVLSMRRHLVLDLISAIILAFSPWIFGFSGFVLAPHMIIGVLEIIVVAMSVSVSGSEVKEKKFSGLHPVH